MPTVASMIIGIRRDDAPKVARIAFHRGVKVRALVRSLPVILHCARRENGGSGYSFMCDDLIAPYYKFVKLYSDVPTRDCTIADVDLGYHEERLTPLERLRAKMAMPHYFDIPF